MARDEMRDCTILIELYMIFGQRIEIIMFLAFPLGLTDMDASYMMMIHSARSAISMMSSINSLSDCNELIEWISLSLSLLRWLMSISFHASGTAANRARKRWLPHWLPEAHEARNYCEANWGPTLSRSREFKWSRQKALFEGASQNGWCRLVSSR